MFKRQDEALRMFLKVLMADRIDYLLKTKEPVNLIFFNTSDIRDYLEELGYAEWEGGERGIIDTNGWEVSWWYKFEKDDEVLTLAGDVYHGSLNLYYDRSSG